MEMSGVSLSAEWRRFGVEMDFGSGGDEQTGGATGTVCDGSHGGGVMMSDVWAVGQMESNGGSGDGM